MDATAKILMELMKLPQVIISGNSSGQIAEISGGQAFLGTRTGCVNWIAPEVFRADEALWEGYIFLQKEIARQQFRTELFNKL